MSTGRGIWTLFALVFCCFGPSVVQAQSGEVVRRVLLLYPNDTAQPATAIIGEAIRRRLVEQLPLRVEIFPEYLDATRFPGSTHEELIARYLGEKYARKPLDLVITLGPDALRFMVRSRTAIAPRVPIVYCCISRESLPDASSSNDISGIVSEFDLTKTLTLATSLQPRARNVVVIAGASEFDRRWEKTARDQLAPYASRYEISFLVGLPKSNLLEELARLPRDTIVLLTTVFRDGSGQAIVPRDLVPELTSASSAPMYAPYDTYIGRGIVGGHMDTFESSGIAIADLALDVLAGRKPAIPGPRPSTASAYRVDWRQMKRWDLSEGNLPADTVVLFKDPSFWEQHRELVLGTAGAFALQSAFIAFLLIQMRRRRRAENSLAESEERMAFAAASVNVGLWQYDRTSGTVWATDHCRAMFGMAATQQPTLEAFLQAIHPDDRRAARRWMRDAAEARLPIIGEFRVVLKGDHVVWYLARGQAGFDDHGNATGISGTFSDITARKSAENEADTQRQMLAHVTRVSALGELSGAIAHEINQPLAAILANAQAARRMLATQPPDLVEVGEVLNDIILEDNRADSVIRRLRGMLRKGESKTQPVVLNDLVQPVLRLMRSELANRGISVKLELTDNLPAVTGDPIQLQQVLINLVMNAMDAVTSPGAFQRTIVVATRVPGPGQVEMIVADRGPGLGDASEARAFEPFYTTKENGLGLGLAISASIAGSHGGILRLDNDSEGGARASLTLPVLDLAAAAE